MSASFPHMQIVRSCGVGAVGLTGAFVFFITAKDVSPRTGTNVASLCRCEASLTSATGWRHALTLHRAPAPQLLSDSLCLIVRFLLHAHREAQRRSCERVAALLTQPQARLRKPSGLGKARQ